VSGRLELCDLAVLRSAGLPFRALHELTEPDLDSNVDRAGDDAERAAERAVIVADEAITRLCRTEDFQRAVGLSHPEILRNAVLPIADGQTRRRRKRRRSVIAVVQRLAAKNDTANGYGPMDLVELGGPADLTQPVAAAGTCAQRAGLIGAWVVERIARTLEADPRLQLPDRLVSTVRLHDDHLVVGQREIRLSQAEREALRQGTNGEAALGRLRRAGLVRRRVRMYPSCTDPLSLLLAELHRVPGAGEWIARLTALHHAAQRVADAPWRVQPELTRALRRDIEACTGPLPERPVGEFYTDREVLYQEGRGASHSYRIGGGLLERIQTGLGPVCDLAGRYGLARSRDLASAVRAIAERTEQGLVDLLTTLAETREWYRTTPSTRADELAASFGQRWAECGAVSSERLAEWLADWPEPDLTVLSPDVMLADETVVIGEVHSNLHTFGLFEHFWPESGMRDWLREATSLPARCAQLVTSRSQGKAFLAELPVRSIEFGADALGENPVPIGEVRVRWDGDLPVLVLPGGEVRTLLPSDQANPLHLALSPHAGLLPRLGGPGHVRRLSVDGVVVQRERWSLPAPRIEAKEVASRYVALRRWKAANQLPDRVFVRTAQTPKPFYLDFGNPLLADLFPHWVSAGQTVELTEVLPRPGELWLERSGEFFTSELRMSVVREAGAA
jgi:hypothetical protein